MSAAPHLKGQETAEARESVALQRHIKRLQDGIRKIQAKLKKATGPDQVEPLEKDLAHYHQELKDVEAQLAALQPARDAPPGDEQVVDAPPPPTAADAVGETVTEGGDHNNKAAAAPVIGRPSLQGQSSEEAKDLVAAQRALKKAKDSIRKLVSKKKLAKTPEEVEELDNQVEAANAEIARLEAVLGVVPSADEAGQPTSNPAAATAAPAAKKEKPQQQTAADSVAAAEKKPQQQKQAAAPSSQQQQQDVQNVAMQARPAGRRAPSNLPPTVAIGTPTVKTQNKSATSNPNSPLATNNYPRPGSGLLGLECSTMSRGRRSVVSDYASVIHPRVAEFGLLTQTMQIVGGNARTVGLIDCLTELCLTSPLLSGTLAANFGLKDRKEFDTVVAENIAFVNRCRECSVGMLFVKRVFSKRLFALPSAANLGASVSAFSNARPTNRQRDLYEQTPASPLTSLAPAAFHSRSLPASTSRFLEDSPTANGGRGAAVSQTPTSLSDTDDLSTVMVRDAVLKILADLKEELTRSIDSLVAERSLPHVADGDTLLIYGRCSSIELILLRARAQRISFSVIIVDNAPLHEGRSFAKRLQKQGFRVTYGLLSSVCVLLPQSTKVLFGASAVLQNGDIVSRAGTAVVAAAAKHYRKPVLCFAESYKFVSKAWVGSLVHNAEAVTIQQRPLTTEVECLLDQALAVSSQASTTTGGGVSPQSSAAAGGGGSSMAPQYHFPAVLTPGKSSSTSSSFAGQPQHHVAAAPTSLATDRSVMPIAANGCAAHGYLYDVTPASCVDMVVSEMGCLHTSAIAAAIRDRQDREDMLAN